MMMNENKIIKAEIPFYYVNSLVRVARTHSEHESHQFDQLRRGLVVNKPRANSIIA